MLLNRAPLHAIHNRTSHTYVKPHPPPDCPAARGLRRLCSAGAAVRAVPPHPIDGEALPSEDRQQQPTMAPPSKQEADAERAATAAAAAAEQQQDEDNSQAAAADTDAGASDYAAAEVEGVAAPDLEELLADFARRLELGDVDEGTLQVGAEER